MKIGFVLDDRFDLADGVQQYIRTIGAWLSRQGHEVRYLVAADDSGRTDVVALSRVQGIRFNKNRVRLAKPITVKKAKAVLTAENFDILHVQMPYAPWFAGQVIKAAPVETAIVGTFHVVLDSRLAVQVSRAIRPLYKPTLSRITAICSVSKAAQDYLEQSLGVRSTIIPNAVDIRRFKVSKEHHKKNRQPTIVFLGRLVERKGAEHVLRAFALLPTPRTAELYIVGDGPLREKLEKLAVTLGVTEQVTFTGFVSEADKARYLRTADIAVFPATGGESFGIVLIEAIAAGAGVVLGGDNVGYRSVLGKSSQALFRPTDHQGLANRITALLTTPALLSDLHQDQQQLVPRFDVATVGPELLEFYEEAMHTHQKVG